MKVICAWCNAVIKDGSEGELVSHSICQDCKARELAELQREENIRQDRRARVLHFFADTLAEAFAC